MVLSQDDVKLQPYENLVRFLNAEKEYDLLLDTLTFFNTMMFKVLSSPVLCYTATLCTDHRVDNIVQAPSDHKLTKFVRRLDRLNIKNILKDVSLKLPDDNFQDQLSTFQKNANIVIPESYYHVEILQEKVSYFALIILKVSNT